MIEEVSSPLTNTITVGILTVALAVIALISISRSSNKRKDKEPPLSCPIPFIGEGISFLQDFPKLIQSLQTKYDSSIFTIINFGQRMHFITDIQSIRRIWALPKYFNFADFASQSEANFGGLETKEEIDASGVGAATLAMYAHTMRKEEDLELLAKRFQFALQEAMENVPLLREDGWKDVDLKEFTSVLVWYAAGRSLFGKVWLQNVDVLTSLRQYAQFDEAAPLILSGMPRFMVKKGLDARDYLVRQVMLPVIKSGCADGHEYIRKYIIAIKNAYEGKDDKDIKVSARMVALLFGINTNTMNMLFWVVARVYTGPTEFRIKLQEEIESAMKSYDTWKDIKSNTPLLSSLIIEALRFHSDPNSFRVAEQDCEVSGLGADGKKTYSFRKGDSVFLLSSYDQLKEVEGASDENIFDGERWTKYTSDPKLSKNVLPISSSQVLAPFGGGKHLCPGRFFATVEIHFVIAFCFHHYDFQLLNDKEGQTKSKLPKKVVELSAPINQPKQSMLIRVRKKDHSSR